MQSFADKCDAIRSLLPLVWAHLALLPHAMNVAKYQTPTVDPGREPPPVWLSIDCDGRCSWCEWEEACQGDCWELVMCLLDRKHRVSTIAGTLARLRIAAPQLAGAVEYVYVEPRDPTVDVVAWRQRWADAGVRWMARKIHGEILPLWEKPRTRAERVTEMLQEGERSPLAIAGAVGCDISYVRRIKRTLMVRQERMVSAVS